MVTIYSGKVELGTGMRTALTQIAADELDVPIANVDTIQGHTALTPDQGVTFGSLSIQVGGVQIRQAAATGSKRDPRHGGRPSRRRQARVDCQQRHRAAKSGGGALTYAELVGGKPFAIKSTRPRPQKIRRI